MRRRGERRPEIGIALALVALAVMAYVKLARDGPVRPSGAVGHGLGAMGYVLMLWAALGYRWRRRTMRRGTGPARAWMRAHVVTGLVGPALVLLHSGFAFRGLAGVATLLMLLVVASGIAGRYVYTAIPRGAPDDGELARLEDEIAQIRSGALDAPAGSMADDPDGAGGGAATITAVPVTHRAAVEARIGVLERARAEQLRRRRAALGCARWRRLLSAWWAIHVPLSAALLALGLVHAIAALYYATLSP